VDQSKPPHGFFPRRFGWFDEGEVSQSWKYNTMKFYHPIDEFHGMRTVFFKREGV
jgi:hypothetical protein